MKGPINEVISKILDLLTPGTPNMDKPGYTSILSTKLLYLIMLLKLTISAPVSQYPRTRLASSIVLRDVMLFRKAFIFHNELTHGQVTTEIMVNLG